MSGSGLTEKIFNHVTKLKATAKWVETTIKGVGKVGINPEEIVKKDAFQIKFDEYKGFEGK